MQVGQKVRLRKVQGGLSPDFANKIGEVGTIQKEKIVDGGRMGFVVSFSDNKSAWFFADELEILS